jgi:hypothetical protein
MQDPRASRIEKTPLDMSAAMRQFNSFLDQSPPKLAQTVFPPSVGDKDFLALTIDAEQLKTDDQEALWQIVTHVEATPDAARISIREKQARQ